MGVYVNMPTAILQFLGNNKALVLISDAIVIPTSNAAGLYYADVNLPKTVILLACWHGFNALWYYDGIVDTIERVLYQGLEYQVAQRVNKPIDGVRLFVYQTNNTQKIVIRQFYVLGVMDL